MSLCWFVVLFVCNYVGEMLCICFVCVVGFCKGIGVVVYWLFEGGFVVENVVKCLSCLFIFVSF